MRVLACLTITLAIMFIAGDGSGIAIAQPDADRPACIAACETTAKSCFAAAHGAYDTCKPAANTGCAATPPAEKFKCLTTALTACTTARSSGTEACRATFKTCHAACGLIPSDPIEYWCELDADKVTTDVRTRIQSFCVGPAGKPAPDQLEHCLATLKPTDPEMGYSLECTPLQ